MNRNINWCNELEFLFSVFELFLNELNWNRLEIYLNIFRVMNELLSKNRFCHCELLSVIFYEWKMMISIGNAVLAWFSLQNNLIWISSWNSYCGHWFTLFNSRTQRLAIICKISHLNIHAILNVILHIALCNIILLRLWCLSIIHDFDSHSTVHVSIDLLFDSMLIKFRNQTSVIFQVIWSFSGLDAL